MFKSLIASAAVAVSTIVAPVTAEAGQLTQGQRQLLNTLDAVGTQVEVGECAKDGSLGWFSPKHNFIAICSNVVDSEEQAWETLRHEAVHVAQMCVDPSMDSTVLRYSFLQKYGDPSDWNFIKRAYHYSDWMIELEAFTLMRLSNAQISEFVAESCR